MKDQQCASCQHSQAIKNSANKLLWRSAMDNTLVPTHDTFVVLSIEAAFEFVLNRRQQHTTNYSSIFCSVLQKRSQHFLTYARVILIWFGF